MTVFNDITTLARDMVEESKLTSRREASRRLYDKLCDPNIRYRLATEAPTFKALQSVWELIVTNAILGAQKIHQKTAAGIKSTDIHITFQLIQLADRRYSDEVYTTAARHPETPKELSRYRDAFLLGNKVVRQVLNFCFELLEDERACESSENQILRMVAGILAQTGYVRTFKNESEMQVVLEDVEKRILGYDDQIPYNVQVSAAEVFRNLLRTATVDLAMDLPVLVASCVKMVATFCAKAVAESDVRPSTHNIFLPLLDSITCMMRINPEQACEPLKRHGHVILKFAKNVYRQSLDRLQRDIVHDYFLTHLYVVTQKIMRMCPMCCYCYILFSHSYCRSAGWLYRLLDKCRDCYLEILGTWGKLH